LYSRAGSTLAISPSLEALLRIPGVSRDVDPFFLAAKVIQLPGRPEETFFAAIQRLLAGHALRVDPRGWRISRFWHPADAAQEDVDARNAVSRFEAVMRAAVERALDGRPAVYLSGGVDSALVSSVAQDVSRSRGFEEPLALSFHSPDPASNEEMGQRTVARLLGLPQRALGIADAIDNDPLLVQALDLSRTTPGLMVGAAQPVFDALAMRAAEDGCGTILSGEGGDEWLLPRPAYLADRMRVFDLLSFYRLARAWGGFYPIFGKADFALGILWLRSARPLVLATAGSALRRWIPGRFHEMRKRRFLPGVPPWVIPDPVMRDAFATWAVARLPAPRASELYEHSRSELLVHPNVAEYCENAFAARRRFGIPTRAPLLDAAVVEFLFNLRVSLLVHGGEAKWLARRVLAPKVGKLADEWPKTVYGDSFWTWVMRREGADAWEHLGGAPILTELGVVDGERLDAIFRDSRRTGTNESLGEALTLWHVMSLESWLRPRLQIGSHHAYSD
jgi:asparagine synthetase B (glutamine-hydrolysing)